MNTHEKNSMIIIEGKLKMMEKEISNIKEYIYENFGVYIKDEQNVDDSTHSDICLGG